MDLLTQLLNATLTIGGASILWREIIGNAFGLASAFGGMRRMVWAWPLGLFGRGFPHPPKFGSLRAGRPAGHVYDRELLRLVELVEGPQGWSA